jgi:dTDP-4-amino-4,6-dideoxygalactose transaminase
MTTLPRRVAGRLRDELVRGARLPRRAHLLARGRLITFLRPYWFTEEIEAGLGWAGGDPAQDRADVAATEAEFLHALGLPGLAVATSSGRTALLVGLRALRRGRPGRTEVVLPSYACKGLIEPVLDAGLIPMFADVGNDLNVSLATVAPLLGPRTLAAVVVHLGGKRSEDTAALVELTARHGGVAIEDVCQGLGGRTAGASWGAIAPMAIYSFALGKNLMATAGGVLVARQFQREVQEEADTLGWEDPPAVRSRFAYMLGMLRRDGLRLLRRAATPPRQALAASYTPSRMSGLDARLVRLQLGRLREVLARRAQHAAVLVAALDGAAGLGVPGRPGNNVWTKFTVVAASAAEALRIRRRLSRAGVETEDMYTPLHLRDFARAYARGTLPVTERLAPGAFNLPVRPQLDGAQMAYVAVQLRRALRPT